MTNLTNELIESIETKTYTNLLDLGFDPNDAWAYAFDVGFDLLEDEDLVSA